VTARRAFFGASGIVVHIVGHFEYLGLFALQDASRLNPPPPKAAIRRSRQEGYRAGAGRLQLRTELITAGYGFEAKERAFFFEKKNQKTFIPVAREKIRAMASILGAAEK
jgi:hypothetical protein